MDVAYQLRDPAQDVTFSTRHLIRVNYKVVSQLSQPIFRTFSYLNSVRYSLVIEFCRVQKYLNFCTRLFSKLTYSFVAIELLALKKKAKIDLFCSIEISVFGLKIYVYSLC